jgi:ElaB/YqjD/DUF883 family membrane-anchored ribosome-binding protein
MANETEVIKDQMEETRTSLSEKLETLEQRVAQTVDDAASTVQETVENVKETVSSVKEAFSISRQVQEHPWLMIGGSAALGFVAGRLLVSLSERRDEVPRVAPSGTDWSELSRDLGGRDLGASRRLPEFERPSAQQQEESWLSQVQDRFGPEIDRLKGLAIGALFSTVREVVTRSMSSDVAQPISEVVDGITTKLGGEPLARRREEPEHPPAQPRSPEPQKPERKKQTSNGPHAHAAV